MMKSGYYILHHVQNDKVYEIRFFLSFFDDKNERKDYFSKGCGGRSGV